MSLLKEWMQTGKMVKSWLVRHLFEEAGESVLPAIIMQHWEGWCAVHTKQAGCLFVCLFLCGGLDFLESIVQLLRLAWAPFSHNSPTETLGSPHNPAQSLKVRSGRTPGAGAVSPSPSRFRLCARSCSPRSLWVNKCSTLLFPSAKVSHHTTGFFFSLRCERAKFESWSKKRGARPCTVNPAKVE